MLTGSKKMQILEIEKKVVNHQIKIQLPDNFSGKNVKIIVMDPETDFVSSESKARMDGFMQTGFVAKELASKTEDIWNDL